ncbi:MAG: hypothetical protein IPM13_15295 [Phycisphaerales bacterium]|nr:hypothetical protein [Phycisphaerales bacterium]
MSRSTPSFLGPLVALAWAGSVVTLAECTPTWAARFAIPATGPTAINAVLTHDDGTGERIYAGTDGGIVYMYDRDGWRSLGGRFYGNLSGVTGGIIYALHFHDPDGAGPEPASLYAAGQFRRAGSALDGDIVTCQNVARWNGTKWEAVGNGWAGSFAYALETFDDGNGPRLYIGGLGTTFAPALQRFNAGDNIWETPTPDPLFSSATVRSLKAFNDGSGPALFVGGDLPGAAGVVSPGVVKYTGSAWVAVGGGVTGVTYSMDAFNDGSGAALYLGGSFTFPTPDKVMKWDGTSLSSTGSNISTTAIGPILNTLTVEGETALYASGRFFAVGAGIPVNSVAKYDSEGWKGTGYAHDPELSQYTRTTSLDLDGLGETDRVLVVFDQTQRPSKVVSGVTTPLVDPTPASISTLATYRVLDLDGPGPQPAQLFVVGRYLKYAADGSVEVQRIGVFQNGGWVEFAGGLRNLELAGDVAGDLVNAAAVFDDGTGPALYVGGRFSHNDGSPANSILKYDGATWTTIGTGIQSSGLPGVVYDMLVHNDGSGPALFIAGSFDTAGGQPAANIVKWDGFTWTPVGAGTSGGVLRLLVHDDGTGPALYAGGSFTAPSNYVAKWDGTTWSALGSGLNGTCYAMTSHDEGTGTKLFVTGQFTSAGGSTANRIARWDGAAWSALGAGLGNVSGVTSTIRGRALVSHDDGNGPALYVGGLFSTAGGTTSRAYSVAKWDGSAWSSLDKGVRPYPEQTAGEVLNLVSFQEAGRNVLYVGGNFATVGADRTPCVGFARWACAPAICAGDVNCDGAVNFDDIDLFVEALGYPGGAGWPYPDCPWLSADCDGDGDVDFDDIDPFVALIGTVCQ